MCIRDRYDEYASNLAASLNLSNSSSLTLILIEIDFLISFVPPAVSYTHLDVYKRQMYIGIVHT